MALLALPLALLALSFVAPQAKACDGMVCIQLKIISSQRAFISNYFRVYTYNKDDTPVSFVPSNQINFAILRYVEMHVVVAKSLYDYMGSNEDVVTGKIMQLMNFINTMFYKLNMKIILSSLELWINKDKISIIGTADQLLEQFLNWKNEHLTLRPHDAAFLFVYRNKADSVGSTFAKKMCSKPSSGGIAMFQNGMTLEAFSVIVAQLLGFSVGLYFDDTRACHCSGTVCLMNTRAACSVKDFQNFLHSALSQCLQNKPQFDISYRAPLCGNHVLEDGEQCDCGTVKLKAKGTLCRELEDSECDLKEFCNGTSAECSENHYVEDGHWCEHQTGVCMKGRCQSADRWCRKIFGAQSKSGSLQCYEEINSQKDRMGHCGSTAKGYQDCQWQDLRCGKLVCDYPNRVPFFLENAAIIYAKVQNRLCVTLDYLKGPGIKDPFLIHDGTVCGDNKVCMNQKCVERAVIRMTCDAETKCHGKGKCNNKGNCHCNVGWAPPDCNVADEGGLGGSIDSTFRSGQPDHPPCFLPVFAIYQLSSRTATKPLLGCLFVSTVPCSAIMQMIPSQLEEDFCHRELYLAHMVLSFITMAYVWQEGEKEVPKILPRNLAIPFGEVSEMLGLPPILVHTDFVLVNWKKKNPHGNLEPIVSLPGGTSTVGFILVTFLAEKAAAPGLKV
ncbi:hypothetical protein Chor_002251 [Crotalus horridus]